MKPIVIACPDEGFWHAQRAKALGASEIAALFGVHPHITRRALWLAKRGELAPIPVTEAMEAGLLSEDFNAAWWQKKNPGRRALAPQEFYSDVDGSFDPKMKGAHQIIVRHPSLPLQCTPDRIIQGQDGHHGVLQLKNVSAWLEDDWRDSPPLHYQMQLQAEMFCTGMRWGVLSAIIGGNSHKSFEAKRHEPFLAELACRAEQFWRSIQNDTEPPQAEAGDLELVRRQFPSSLPGLTVELPQPELVYMLANTKAQISQLEAEEEKLLAQIQAIAGPAETITAGGRKVATWKTSTRNESAREARTSEVRTFRLDQKLLAEAKANLPRHEQPVLPA